MQEVTQVKRLENLTKDKIFDSVDEFIYSYFYPVVLALITVVCYVYKLQLGGIALFFLLGSYILATHRDATPLLPILLFFIFLIRDMSVTGSLVFYLMIILPAICLIIHFIRFPLKHFNFGRLFLPLCVVTVALFLGGVLSPYVTAYAEGILYTIPLGPVLLIIYLYFANYVEYPEDFEIRQYFAFLLCLIGFIVSFEFLYYDYNHNVLENNLFTNSEMGCGNVNMVGTMLLIAIPATCYLLVKADNVYPYVLTVLAFYFIIYKTGSDGCLGFACAFLPILAFFVFIRTKGKNHTRFKYITLTTLILVILFLILLIVKEKTSFITDIINKAKNSDSGRTALYNDAVRIFLENPLFGAGFGYHNHQLYSPVGSGGLRLYNSHSTLFQVMGSLGLTGLVAYTYYFYSRFRVLMDNPSDFNLFLCISFIMCSCYGFVDTVEFSTIPTMIVLTLLILTTEFSNAEKKTVYPINKKFKK